MRYYIPAILWSLLILGLSAMPGSSLPDFSLWSLAQPDKIGHLGIYCIFVSIMLWGAYRNFRPDKIPLPVVIFIILFAIFYGISMEFMQSYFFSSRNFDVLDILANIIGCLIGMVSLRFFYRRKNDNLSVK